MQATSYILDTGIEDILYLYNSKSYSAMRKLSGYQSALTQHGITLRMEYMQFFPGSHANLPAIADFLANLDPQIKYRAVSGAEDNLAIGAIKYAHKKGLSIPDDLSVVGYNNSILSTCCEPELTSVDNKLETLCHHIVSTLIGILDNRDMPQKVIFSGELIKRGTTLQK